MIAPRTPSSLTLWLEEALTGWILPVAGLAVLGAAGGLYAAGRLSEGAAAAAVSAVVGLLALTFTIRPALSPAADRPGRWLAVAAAAGALFLSVVPAVAAVVPGRPLAQGALAARGDVMPVPADVPHHVRLLVAAPLPASGTPAVRFTIGGLRPPVEGHLERTYTYARVGRGGRAPVAHDRTEVWLEGDLADAHALTLDRLGGDATGPLRVTVFRDLTPTALQAGLAVAVLALAAAAEARLRRGNVAAVVGMALGYGILVAENATPASAAGVAVGALLLGGFAGAGAGGLAAAIAKRLVPAPPEVAGRAGRRG